jgi:hypothetical protein
MIDPEEVEFLRESLSTEALSDDLRDRISHDQLIELAVAAEPLWNALERVGGMVDSWGGSEFRRVFPETLAFICESANQAP